MKKYIAQLNNENFIYPNNNPVEYDITIEHEINNNSVTGSCSNITVTDETSSGITISFNWSWAKNNAEPFTDDLNEQYYFSVHALPYGLNYFKPWRMVYYYGNTAAGHATLTGTTTGLTITPAEFGMDEFESGDYYFEVRFIGHRSVYPVVMTVPISTIPAALPWTLTTVTPVGQGIASLAFTGDTLSCSTMAAQYATHSTGPWLEEYPAVPNCTSPITCYHGISGGIVYFRLRQYLTYGGTIFSNIVSHDYGAINLDSVVKNTSTEYEVTFTPIQFCDGIIIQWSRNQIDWVDSSVTLDCASSPVTITTIDTDIPYWRVKQIMDEPNATVSISNIITVAP